MSAGLFCQECHRMRDIAGPKRIKNVTRKPPYGPPRRFKAETVALSCGHKKILRRIHEAAK